MHDDTPEGRPQPPKPGPAPLPTEAELSRIAREAVHQPADARLDKQLVRMGLMDASESAESQPVGATTRPIAPDPELARLRQELGRTRVLLRLLVAIVAVLAVVIVMLLLR